MYDNMSCGLLLMKHGGRTFSDLLLNIMITVLQVKVLHLNGDVKRQE